MQRYARPSTVVLTHSAFLTTLPLATLTVGLQDLHPHLVAAARALAATASAVLRAIVFPPSRPCLIAGLVFAALQRVGDLPRLLGTDETD